MLKIELRGGAARAWNDRGAEVLLSGPAGTGKSVALLFKLHQLALKYPGMRGLIVRKTQVSLSSTALDTWRKHIITEAEAAGMLRFYGGSAAEPPQYRYANGSMIGIGGMDKPTKIMSSEWDIAYVQEAIELSVTDWEAITTRLRNGVVPYQQIIADTNPDLPTHWLKKRAESGRTTLIESRHEDNPMLFQRHKGQLVITDRGADYIAKLDALTGPRHARLRKGLWVSAEGAIYDDFDPAVHVIDRFDIPWEWPRWWSVDFGFVHPFVLQCWTQDPDGQLILYREVYRTGRTVDQHARDLLDLITDPDPAFDGPRIMAKDGRIWREPRPQAVICDHDAEGRQTFTAQTGLPTKAADKRVLEGIQRVQRRLRPRGDGRPGLVIMRDAAIHRDQALVEAAKPACTAEELPGYTWAVKPGNAQMLKEEPLKEMDDGSDALRYLVMFKDPVTRGGVRAVG